MQPSIFKTMRPMMRDMMGPLILSDDVADRNAGFIVMRSIVPPGAVIPLHSHADHETIIVVQGELTVWQNKKWLRFGPGDRVDILPNDRHALRNDGGAEVTLVLVSTASMRRFMEAISMPAAEVTGPPSPERIGSFVKLAIEHGFWLGTPEEQEALGLP